MRALLLICERGSLGELKRSVFLQPRQHITFIVLDVTSMRSQFDRLGQ